MQFPMLLALLGTALMAVVIFAPSRISAPVTMSFAPPPFERCEPIQPEPSVAGVAAWPALVDLDAASCDAAARLGLVEALSAVRTPWSEAILRRALAEEPDATVREAVAAVMRVASP